MTASGASRLLPTSQILPIETPSDRPRAPTVHAGTILVLGVGNLLVGDEGAGVHAIRALEEAAKSEPWPDHVHLLDGGTGGFHLLEHLRSYERVILIDATCDGAPAGTVAQLRPRTVGEFPSALGAHDIGLQDLLRAAALLGPLPEITVITIAIEDLKPMCLDLSPSVAGALPEVVRRVREIVKRR